MPSSKAFLQLAALLVTSLVTAQAFAHPFHVSIAEAEWNAETKRLEVALRVAPDDLETALKKQEGKKITVDESESSDEAITVYLKETFALREHEDDKEPLELHWTGKEVTPKAAWLYFEVDCPDGVEGLVFTNKVLVDEEESQINTAKIKVADRKVTLRFDRKNTKAKISFDEAKQE